METFAIEKGLDINVLEIKKGVLVLRAINHPLRQQMLQLMHKSNQMTVTDLYNKLRIDQSVASQHLAILRKARLVITSRKGKFIHYSVDYNNLDQVHAIAAQLVNH